MRGRRLAQVIALVLVLVGWIVLQVRHSEEAHARYARQSLRVHAVTVWDGVQSGPVVSAPAPDAALADGLGGAVVTALWPRLDFVSSCLMTEDSSRAPVEVELFLEHAEGGEISVYELVLHLLSADGTSRTAEPGERWREEASRCLESALAPVQWPQAASRVSLVLADGRLATRARLALTRGRALGGGR